MQDEILMSSLKINKVDNAETFKQLKGSEYYNSEEVYVLGDYISSSDIASGIEAHNNDEAAHQDIQQKVAAAQSTADKAIPKPNTAASGQVLTYNGSTWEAADAPDTGVTSVNNRNGAVTLTKSDVGLGNVDNVKQYSASNEPPYPVTSVNGQTGDVTIEIPEVNYPVTSVNGQTGDITIDIPTLPEINYPVTSVNGQTGEVVLTASSVGARPDTWTPSLADLGAAPAYTLSTEDLVAGTSTLAKGTLWFVYEIQSPTINFSVRDVSFEANRGMTWEQWIGSAYNTSSYSISGDGSISVGRGEYLLLSDGFTAVDKTETIIEGYNYERGIT